MLNRFNTSNPEQVNDRVFRFVISDESKDRYGTVIKLDGWDLSGYEKNGVVAYQHITMASNPDYIVGRGKAWIEEGRLMGEVEFEPEGQNPIADKVVNKLKFGSLSATSVGFNPMTFSYGDHRKAEDPDTLYFRKQELLEWSIVNIPANSNATIQKALEDFVNMAKEDKDKEAIEALKKNTSKEMDSYQDRYFRLRFQSIH